MENAPSSGAIWAGFPRTYNRDKTGGWGAYPSHIGTTFKHPQIETLLMLLLSG